VAGTIVAFGGDDDSLDGAQTAIAAAAAGLFVGSRVCALVAGGGYAEYCVAPLGQCLPSPASLTDAEAASLPETFFTVWSNVFERGRLRAGEWLLVHGGTSGIGATAIQLARAFGAHVVVTCGTAEKCAQALALGATHAVCYRNRGGDWAGACRALLPAGYDVILDMVAGAYVEREVELLADDGRLVLIAVQGGVQANFNAGLVLRKRLTITGSTLRARPVAFKSAIAAALRERVWPLWSAQVAPAKQADDGSSEASQASQASQASHSSQASPVLRANVDRTFRGADANGAADAHRLMESGAFVGKIVLTWE
jgi:NADPH2:quinone reductase